jgi:hypothetical protein
VLQHAEKLPERLDRQLVRRPVDAHDILVHRLVLDPEIEVPLPLCPLTTNLVKNVGLLRGRDQVVEDLQRVVISRPLGGIVKTSGLSVGGQQHLPSGGQLKLPGHGHLVTQRADAE